MPEKMNAAFKAQLVKYLPEALRKLLEMHEKVAHQDMTIKTKDNGEYVNQSATMKAMIEQQKAGKSVIVHVEELLKLASLILQDEVIKETPQESKQELIDMIEEAQKRVADNRPDQKGNHVS